MNRINLIIKEMPHELALKKVANDLCLSFIVRKTTDFKNISLTTLHSPNFYSCSDISFSIYFDCKNEDEIIELTNFILENIDFVMQLFFHPQFERNNDIPLFFANKELFASINFSSLLEHLSVYVAKQGFNNLEVKYINNTPGEDDITDKLFSNKDIELFNAEYELLLTKMYYVGRYLNFTYTSPEFVHKILQSKNEVETQVKKKDLQLFKYLNNYRELQKKMPVLEQHLILLKEDLNNQKRYLKILKEQDEGLKINNFYYNEYEILPLWYKKLGHILKVVSGKRSFRSLFDNNVKKYKS